MTAGRWARGKGGRVLHHATLSARQKRLIASEQGFAVTWTCGATAKTMVHPGDACGFIRCFACCRATGTEFGVGIP